MNNIENVNLFKYQSMLVCRRCSKSQERWSTVVELSETSHSQPASLSEHLCGRRQLGDAVNAGDFSAPYHLSEDHVRQSFLSLLFLQHLTLLLLSFLSRFKSYSHCFHVP